MNNTPSGPVQAALKSVAKAMDVNRAEMSNVQGYRYTGIAEADRPVVRDLALGFMDAAPTQDFLAAYLDKQQASPIAGDGEKPWRIYFSGSYGSEAPELMRRIKAGVIKTDAMPQPVQSLLEATPNAVMVDFDAIRQAVLHSEGWKNFVAAHLDEKDKIEQNAVHLIRPVVSSLVHGLYTLAQETNLPVWTNESLAWNGYINDAARRDEIMGKNRIGFVALLPKELKLEENMARLQAQGLSIPAEAVTESHATLCNILTPVARAVSATGAIIEGSLEQGFKPTASFREGKVTSHLPVAVRERG